MNKNKTFRFTTETTPETEVILNGRYGQPLDMSLDEGSKTTDERDCSRKSVLSALCDLLVGENKADPYTDEDLSGLLAEKGFAVARRTVAKYRELLGIPKRSERRIVSI